MSAFAKGSLVTLQWPVPRNGCDWVCVTGDEWKRFAQIARGDSGLLQKLSEHLRFMQGLESMTGEAVNPAGPYLVSVPGPVDFYDPMGEQALHRKFAELKPTQKTVKAFAERYGRLGVGVRLPTANGETAYGEHLSLWQWEIRMMRDLVELWDRVRVRNVHEPTASKVAELGKRFTWNNVPGQRSLVWRPLSGVGPVTIASEEDPESQFIARKIKPGEVLEAARFIVAGGVAMKLRGQATPASLPFRGGELGIIAESLLAAMYANFTLELAGRAGIAEPCANPVCKIPFKPKRSDQKFCSLSCRQKHFYENSPKSRKFRGGKGKGRRNG